ncbi:hypothetical protein WJT74_05870 [Sphingomicrobium sp. XHP0239]
MTICKRVAAAQFDPPKKAEIRIPQRLRARCQVVRDNLPRSTD